MGRGVGETSTTHGDVLQNQMNRPGAAGMAERGDGLMAAPQPRPGGAGDRVSSKQALQIACPGENVAGMDHEMLL